MAAFSINEKRGDGRCVLYLVGELDVAAAPTMRETALASLDDPDCQTLVLDLSELTFLDSTGMGCWVEIRNHTQQSGQHLELRSVNPRILRTLSIAGLVDVFGLGEAQAGESA